MQVFSAGHIVKRVWSLGVYLCVGACSCTAHLKQWQLVNHLARALAAELARLMIPGSTLQVQPRHITTMTADVHKAQQAAIT
jgi:hypothetical protein